MESLEASPLRMRVYRRFRAWEEAGLIKLDIDRSRLLWGLLGRAPRPHRERDGSWSYFVPADDLTDAEASICQALLSPHGFAVYKMLLARQEVSDE